jgi:hypothetical protein
VVLAHVPEDQTDGGSSGYGRQYMQRLSVSPPVALQDPQFYLMDRPSLLNRRATGA